MTTMALLDAMAETDPAPAVTEVRTMPLKIAVVRELIASSLAELRRIREYEQLLFTASPVEPPTRATHESIWRLFNAWAEEATQIGVRARSLAIQGQAIPELSQLEDGLGSTRARLTVTPAQIESAINQVKQGLSIPAKELRDELHARVRA